MKINEIIVEGFWDSMGKGMASSLGAKTQKDNAKVATGGKKAMAGVQQSIDDQEAAYQQKQQAADIMAVGKRGGLRNQPVDQPAAQADPHQWEIPDGQQLVVISPKNKGKYIKNSKGWFNAVGKQISNAQSIKWLEQLADAGGKLEPIPTTPQQPQPTRPTVQPKRTKTTRPTRGVAR